MPSLLSITKSKAKGKKYTATFELKDGKTKKVHFGAAGYSDYTINKDPAKKRSYIARHSGEDWSDPMKAGTLSRYILWEDTSLKSAIKKYKKRFKL
jgi:hypothetical protein